MQGDQSRVYPSADNREERACLGQENTFPGPDIDWLLHSLQTSPDSHWRAIHDNWSSGGNKAPDTINPTLFERHSYRGGGIMVLGGISLGSHTNLHVFQGGTLAGVRYRDEIL
ncbi:DDE_3 domain-containing protein [Trichonephila clavipes]|nr:DDE_3 domain-containing protein [Trichonephila clavipes]